MTEADTANPAGRPGEGLWSIYLQVADKQDLALTERWKGQMEGILIFVSAILYLLLVCDLSYALRTANVLHRLLFFVVTRGIAICLLQITNLALYLAAPSRLYW